MGNSRAVTRYFRDCLLFFFALLHFSSKLEIFNSRSSCRGPSFFLSTFFVAGVRNNGHSTVRCPCRICCFYSEVSCIIFHHALFFFSVFLYFHVGVIKTTEIRLVYSCYCPYSCPRKSLFFLFMYTFIICRSHDNGWPFIARPVVQSLVVCWHMSLAAVTKPVPLPRSPAFPGTPSTLAFSCTFRDDTYVEVSFLFSVSFSLVPFHRFFYRFLFRSTVFVLLFSVALFPTSFWHLQKFNAADKTEKRNTRPDLFVLCILPFYLGL